MNFIEGVAVRADDNPISRSLLGATTRTVKPNQRPLESSQGDMKYSKPALREVLGSTVPDGEIEKMAKFYRLIIG